jgi:hypothetical protein
MMRWIVLFTAMLLMSCSTPRVFPSRTTQKAFGLIDSIEVDELLISDANIVGKLKEVHSRSKWEPMPITLPADIITIYGVEKGVRRFKLLYGAGWIMETNDDGEIVRRGSLEIEDRKWMDDKIRAQLPPKANVI